MYALIIYTKESIFEIFLLIIKKTVKFFLIFNKKNFKNNILLCVLSEIIVNISEDHVVVIVYTLSEYLLWLVSNLHQTEYFL